LKTAFIPVVATLAVREKDTMPKHIVVINDTEEILELFKAILHDEAGHEVTLLSFHPQIMGNILELMPDLIISDHVFGEEKIGWQFIQKLKMVRETACIPVIVCSGAVKELKELEGFLTSKNVGILYKPFDVDELLTLVEKHLHNQEDTDIHTGGPNPGLPDYSRQKKETTVEVGEQIKGE
jgi:DNA-binding NtrC family response regulator